jgi:hypothetical protein
VSNLGKKYDMSFSRNREAIEDALMGFADKYRPVTVRQLYYQCVVLALVVKDEGSYKKIGTLVKILRENEIMPWDWVRDGSRGFIESAMYDTVSEGVASALHWIRLNPWKDKPETVLILVEKDALSSVLEEVTDPYGVTLLPGRGFCSVTKLKEAAERVQRDGRPCYVYQLGDFDPSGESAMVVTRRTFERYAPDAKFIFETLALKPEQLLEMDRVRLEAALRPIKDKDTRAASFRAKYDAWFREHLGIECQCVELDALEPDYLRDLVRAAIQRHITDDEIETCRIRAEREAATIRRKLRLG